jgi:hypothetical protein
VGTRPRPPPRSPQTSFPWISPRARRIHEGGENLLCRQPSGRPLVRDQAGQLDRSVSPRRRWLVRHALPRGKRPVTSYPRFASCPVTREGNTGADRAADPYDPSVMEPRRGVRGDRRRPLPRLQDRARPPVIAAATNLPLVCGFCGGQHNYGRLRGRVEHDCLGGRRPSARGRSKAFSPCHRRGSASRADAPCIIREEATSLRWRPADKWRGGTWSSRQPGVTERRGRSRRSSQGGDASKPALEHRSTPRRCPRKRRSACRATSPRATEA